MSDKIKSIEETVEEIIDALITDVHFEKTYPAHTAYHLVDFNRMQSKLREALKQDAQEGLSDSE